MSSFTVDRIMGTSLNEKRKPVVVNTRITTDAAQYVKDDVAQFFDTSHDVVKSEPRAVLHSPASDDDDDDGDDGFRRNEKHSSTDVASPGGDTATNEPKSPTAKEDGRSVETFVAVIAQAILSAPGKRMTLSSIYHYIASHYSHFNHEKGPGWRNSVRHNLSSNDCFVKAVRAENGKGHYWMIHPKDLPEFTKGNFRRRRKPRRPRCHHAVMINGNPSENFFYHTLSTATIPFSIPSPTTTSQDRIINNGRSQLRLNIFDGGAKLPLSASYERQQLVEMGRNALTLRPSIFWPSEIASRTYPNFAGSLNLHQYCACQSPDFRCYYHNYK